MVSATQCGAVVRCVTSANPGKSNDDMVPQDISCETVHQSIVEGGIVCDPEGGWVNGLIIFTLYWDR